MYAQVVRSNLASQIAENIEQLIIKGELQVGDRLPGEIELAERIGASRTVLREAITMLRERGLVDVKNGSGAFVVRPESGALSSVVGRLTAVGATSPYEIYEVRMALEVRVCGLVAQNATDEDITKLWGLLDDMERDYQDVELWFAHDLAFHGILADMTYNSLFPAFLQPLITAVFTPASINPPSLEDRKGGMQQHRRITAAIAARDRAGAEQAMADHLQKYLNDLVKTSSNIE